MIGLLRAVGERGERALRRGVWSFAGAGLIVVALGFAGAAIVEALAAFLPRYAALGAATLFLLIAAAVCFRSPAKSPMRRPPTRRLRSRRKPRLPRPLTGGRRSTSRSSRKRGKNRRAPPHSPRLRD